MLSPSDAFRIAVWTIPVRAYDTRTLLANHLCGCSDRAVSNAGAGAHRQANRSWEEAAPALKRIVGLLQGNGVAPPPDPAASGSARWAAALYALVKANVAAGSPASAALDVGAFAADVAIASGALADFLAVGPHGQATEPLRAEGERRAGSLEAARYCLGETLADVGPLLRSEALSPSVGEVLDELMGALREAPPPEAARLAAWTGMLREKLRLLGVTLAFPPEPARLDPPSVEERAALDGILADPRAEAPRRTFARLATERRDPRGAFVLDQLETSARRRALGFLVDDSELSRHVLRRHPEWWEELRRLGVADVRFVRGFVEEITLDAGLFLGSAEALYRAAPVLGVRLTAAAPRVAEVAVSPHVERLVSLAFPDGGLDDSHVAALAASPRLRGLLSLDLAGSRVTDQGLRSLAASPHLTALTQCVTRGNPCGRFYRSDWSHQEIPSLEWLPTELYETMVATHGDRRWFRPDDRVLGLDELV